MTNIHQGAGETQAQQTPPPTSAEGQLASLAVSRALVDSALAQIDSGDGRATFSADELRTIRVGLQAVEAAKPAIESRPARISRPGAALALTSTQAANYLGVSLATVRRWTNTGDLKTSRTPGGQRRFSVDQLDAFLVGLRES